MNKEPITLNGLNKLKEELIFLKEKKRHKIVAAIAIIVLGPKDFPVMLKKVGSWVGTTKKYINNIQNEVSNIDLEDNNIQKKEDTKKEDKDA